MNEKDFETNEGQISKFIPYDQHQELLLPKSVQDYVHENHIARAVSRIIDYIEITVFILSYDHQLCITLSKIQQNSSSVSPFNA